MFHLLPLQKIPPKLIYFIGKSIEPDRPYTNIFSRAHTYSHTHNPTFGNFSICYACLKKVTLHTNLDLMLLYYAIVIP